MQATRKVLQRRFRFVSRGDRKRIVQAIKKAENAVTGLESVLASIHKRRNEWFAHLDPRTVRDPAALAVKAKLSIPDLDRAFQETEDIVLEMSSLYESVIGKLHYLGDDDYKSALNWIRRAKCTSIENYEKEFGPWTGPRPKGLLPQAVRSALARRVIKK